MAAGVQFSDVSTLLNLHQVYSFILPTIGWHPWYISKALSQQDIIQTLESFQPLLETHPFPVGEIGLDFHPKWKDSKEHQLNVFQWFMEQATRLNRPIIVHCVRAHHEVLRLLKRHPNTTLYIHDFKGSPELCAQYLRYDVYFGLSILHWSNRSNRLILSIPSDRVLLESDTFISLSEMEWLIQRHRLTKTFVEQTTQNLFQYLQGTSNDFTEQFQKRT